MSNSEVVPHKILVTINARAFELMNSGECHPSPKAQDKLTLTFDAVNIEEAKQKISDFISGVKNAFCKF